MSTVSLTLRGARRARRPSRLADRLRKACRPAPKSAPVVADELVTLATRVAAGEIALDSAEVDRGIEQAFPSADPRLVRDRVFYASVLMRRCMPVSARAALTPGAGSSWTRAVA